MLTVVVSGTPVQGTDYAVPPGVSVVAKANEDNLGTITVAETSANAINTTTENFKLLPGQSISLQVLNSNMLWFDSTASGDKVNIILEY